MKYIVKANNVHTYKGIENIEHEFNNEADARYDAYWFLAYSSAESVEMIVEENAKI